MQACDVTIDILQLVQHVNTPTVIILTYKRKLNLEN